MLGRHSDRADQAAERERTGVAHEDRGRRRVEPEKSEPRADHRPAHHGKLAGAGHEMDLQIVGEHRIADEIGNPDEARGGDHHRADGEAIESVGQVHGVAGADDDEGSQDRKEPAEVDGHVLDHREHQRGGEGRASEASYRETGGERDRGLDREPHPSREAAMGLPRHLEIIVVEPDQAEAERHREYDPDIRIARIGPQQRRDDDAEQHHQAAHGRRAGLGDQMRFWAVGADRLALALPDAQMIDDPGAEHEHEHQRRDHRACRPHRQIAEDIEDRQRAGEIGQPIEHRINLERTPLRGRHATRTDG